MAALLALGGALCWGTGDFFGGLATRRAAVVTVLATSQAMGLAALLAWVALAHDDFPGAPELVPAALAGVAGTIGLGALYRGLAVGSMGIVAPISAASPIVPLTVDAARGVVPGTLQLLGVGLVLGGIAAVSREPRGRERHLAHGVGLALLAALGFGLFVVGLDAGSDESAAWAVAAARATGLALAVGAALLVTRDSLRPAAALLPLLAAVGVFDTAANVLVAVATTTGAAGIVAVLSALYPVVTVLLARALLREQLSAQRRAGGAVALAGAALVAAG